MSTLRFDDNIEVRQNLHLVARERGKIVDRRDGHNIFLDIGRQWLAELITYASFSPDLPQRDDRIKYLGTGIGGTRQLALATANSGDLLADYGGTNTQTDLVPSVTQLERPVRVTGGSGGPAVGDRWVERVSAPPLWPTAQSVTFYRMFSQVEVSYTPYITVPLSEIGLFTADANPESQHNPGLMVAYDTFDTLSKTSAVEIEVRWTLQF